MSACSVPAGTGRGFGERKPNSFSGLFPGAGVSWESNV